MTRVRAPLPILSGTRTAPSHTSTWYPALCMVRCFTIPELTCNHRSHVWQLGAQFSDRTGPAQFDMGLFKRFKVGESKALEFRAEGFNVFNHPQWTGINNTTCGYVTDTGSTNSGSNDCVNGNSDNGEVPVISCTPVEFITDGSENSA